MGLEVLAAAAVIGGTAYQAERQRSAEREQRRAASREREARRVSQAQQERERQLAIRQQQREERIRRAQVVSAAEAVGVSGSSVEASTIGSGQTIAGAGQAFATGASMSADRISLLQQQAAKFRGQAQFDLVQGQMGGALASLGMSAFQMGGNSTATTNPGDVAGSANR